MHHQKTHTTRNVRGVPSGRREMVDCDKLKMYTINLKATTKIRKQRVIANKSTKEMKWNLKNVQKKRKKIEQRTE